MTVTGEIYHLSAEMRACVENCTDCHQICLATVPHCLAMGGDHAAQAHIRLLLDCAEICRTSANFMLIDSAFHPKICGLCAEICEACAADCERLAGSDAQMLACAAACRKCAESCRNMAAGQHHVSYG